MMVFPCCFSLFVCFCALILATTPSPVGPHICFVVFVCCCCHIICFVFCVFFSPTEWKAGVVALFNSHGFQKSSLLPLHRFHCSYLYFPVIDTKNFTSCLKHKSIFCSNARFFFFFSPTEPF